MVTGAEAREAGQEQAGSAAGKQSKGYHRSLASRWKQADSGLTCSCDLNTATDAGERNVADWQVNCDTSAG